MGHDQVKPPVRKVVAHKRVARRADRFRLHEPGLPARKSRPNRTAAPTQPSEHRVMLPTTTMEDSRSHSARGSS